MTFQVSKYCMQNQSVWCCTAKLQTVWTRNLNLGTQVDLITLIQTSGPNFSTLDHCSRASILIVSKFQHFLSENSKVKNLKILSVLRLGNKNEGKIWGRSKISYFRIQFTLSNTYILLMWHNTVIPDFFYILFRYF